MTLDEDGRLYLAARGGAIYDKAGELIETVEVPEKWTANVCFGGKDMQTLFITASSSIYSLKMRVKGMGQ
jgi:gluconolactonase